MQALTTWNAFKDGNALLLRNGDQALRFSRESRLVINLLGKTGSGKGTQGEELAKKYRIPHISLGDLYRNALLENTSLAKVIAFQANQGISYDVEEVGIGMLAKRLERADCDSGFILDGYPRTAQQAVTLNKTLLHPHDLQIPINLEVPDDLVIQRIANRFFCSPCQKQIREHIEIRHPGHCPDCDQPLTKRVDDAAKGKVESKLLFHHDTIGSILSALSQRDLIHTISCKESDSPQSIFSRITQIVNQTLDDRFKTVQYYNQVDNVA